MSTITPLTNTAFAALASKVKASQPERSESFEVEIDMGNLTYYADVEYYARFQEEIGGSYENREFEVFYDIAEERYSVTAITVYNNDTFEEYFATASEIKKLEKHIN